MDIVEQQKIRDIDFSEYQCQGGAFSLFNISILAQNFIVKVIVPPSVLIGFKDNSRFMWNCTRTGKIIVKTGFISPEDIDQFINDHFQIYF